MKTAVLLTTEDRFFLSHRRPIAEALRAHGFEVHVAAADTGESARVRDAGFAFHPVPLVRASVSPVTEAATLAAVVRLYRRLRPALVHHSTIKANVYGSIAARVAQVPAVVNTVTGMGFALIEKPDDDVGARARRRFAQLLYANLLTGVTVFQNADQMRLFVDSGWVKPERSMLVRGAGVDLSRFASTPLPQKPVVLLPARMLWDKGVGELVEAAERLDGFARFVLCGGTDPENHASVSEQALRGWEADGLVEWWGHRSDMPEVFAQASIVALPSYAEGMPLALAEAQACGRPCITTDAPGCREAIIPEVTGLLVPLRDGRALAAAIERLIASRALLEKMGAAARRFAEAELGRDHVIAQTLEACRLAGAPL